MTRTSTDLRSRLASTAAAVGLAVAALLQGAGPAAAGPAEPELVTLANQARAAAGVAPLASRADLTGIARAWSERMAREGRLHHNPVVGSQVCCWRALAENRRPGPHLGDPGVPPADGAGRPSGARRPAGAGPRRADRLDPRALAHHRGQPLRHRRTADRRARRPGPVRPVHRVPARSVYWSPRTGAHEVYGAIRDRWAAERWEAGRLGYPTRGEYDVPGGRATDFERGRIAWHRATGATTVQLR